MCNPSWVTCAAAAVSACGAAAGVAAAGAAAGGAAAGGAAAGRGSCIKVAVGEFLIARIGVDLFGCVLVYTR